MVALRGVREKTASWGCGGNFIEVVASRGVALGCLGRKEVDGSMVINQKHAKARFNHALAV